MPRIREHEQTFPAWCELQSFEIVRLAPGETTTFEPGASRAVVIVGSGEVVAANEPWSSGTTFDLAAGPVELVAGPVGATAIRMDGTWSDDFGGLGIFGVREVEEPSNPGDPVDYPRATSFDAHFHDCDEYWIVFEGRGVAVSEGVAYEVGPGDCVATGMGHHHDFPQAGEPVRAVFFETTMQGAKRRGHLWEHTHGPAEPHPDRV